MGTYDSVHTGAFCGQTKALGKTLRSLVPGDEVHLYPLPSPSDFKNLEDWLDDWFFNRAKFARDIAAGDPGDFQVWICPGGWLQVRNHRIAGWQISPEAQIPGYNNTGGAMTADQVQSVSPALEADWADELADCPVCAELRGEPLVGPHPVAYTISYRDGQFQDEPSHFVDYGYPSLIQAAVAAGLEDVSELAAPVGEHYLQARWQGHGLTLFLRRRTTDLAGIEYDYDSATLSEETVDEITTRVVELYRPPSDSLW